MKEMPPPPPPPPPCMCVREWDKLLFALFIHHTHTHTHRVSTLGSNGYCKPKAIKFVYVGHAQPDWSGSCEKLKGGGRLQQAREVGPAMEQLQSGGGEGGGGGGGEACCPCRVPFPTSAVQRKRPLAPFNTALKGSQCAFQFSPLPPSLPLPSTHPPTPTFELPPISLHLHPTPLPTSYVCLPTAPLPPPVLLSPCGVGGGWVDRRLCKQAVY